MSCSIPCCKNRYPKCRLFRLPRNENRKNLWIKNCNQTGWIPPKCAKFCEFHFDESQFEQGRIDGWKKLKPNAIPTIFEKTENPILIETSENFLNETCSQTSNFGNDEKRETDPLRIIEIDLKNGTVNESKTFDEDTKNSSKIIELLNDDTNNSNEIFSLINEDSNDSFDNSSHFDENTNYLNEISSQLEGSAENSTEIKNWQLEKQRLLEHVQEANTALNFNRKLNVDHLKDMRRILDIQDEVLKNFLNSDQIKALHKEKMPEWSSETIIKALKLRSLLGWRKYVNLQNTGYPTPSIKTIKRRLQEIELPGIFIKHFLTSLRNKVKSMDPGDRFCTISLGEMQITSTLEILPEHNQQIGFVTLGDTKTEKEELGTHLLLVLIRGIRTCWKQLVACEVISKNTETKHIVNLLQKCIGYIEDCGLYVIALCSNMEDVNVKICNELNIYAEKNGVVKNNFQMNNHDLYVIPNACYLLKCLRKAFLKEDLFLPEELVDSEKLPSNVISSQHIASLWKSEIKIKKSCRLLCHLKNQDINPRNGEKLNTNAAIRLFSHETAQALRQAVHYDLLPSNALATSYFIQLIADWFKIASNKKPTALSSLNKERKMNFLTKFTHIFRIIEIKDNWKSLIESFILASISLYDASSKLLNTGEFNYILTHRFNQDALDNCFSEIRGKKGIVPTAFQCIEIVRPMIFSQLISDVKKTKFNDFDLLIMDQFSNKTDEIVRKVLSEQLQIYPDFDVQFKTVTIDDDEEIKKLSNFDLHLLFYLSGYVLNALFKTSICYFCQMHFESENLDADHRFREFAKEFVEGGLRIPNIDVFNLILNCESIYKRYVHYIFHNGYKNFVTKIVNDVNADFPVCYMNCVDAKLFIVKYFFKIRSLNNKCPNDRSKRSSSLDICTKAKKIKT